MDNNQLAYFAGFFDGEGSVSIKEDNRPGENYPRHHVLIQISQGSPGVLENYKKNFGGSICSYISAPCGNRVWRYTLAATKAFKFLLAIRPYVVIKKAQVDLAIDFKAVCKPLGTRGYPIPSGLISMRRGYKAKMQGLNARRSV